MRSGEVWRGDRVRAARQSCGPWAEPGINTLLKILEARVELNHQSAPRLDRLPK
jgi:hypothetical protein